METPFELPTFRGYTVDAKLKQFRKITDRGIKFIDFDSEKGKQLLAEMRQYFLFLFE